MGAAGFLSSTPPQNRLQPARTVQETVSILIVEDDDGHAALAERNLRRSGLTNEIVRFRDGPEVLEFLEERAVAGMETGEAFLMLLDICMPGIDGIEILRRIKGDPRWSKMPVIMLTTTDDPRDVEACHEIGCNSYVTKPIEYDEFVDVLQRLGSFMQVVKVPRSAV